MKYEIKPCTEADADRIWEKDFEAYRALAPIAEEAEEERFVFKVTDGADTIIGGCVLAIDSGKDAEFERLWVEERYRRRGIGSALIREAERAAGEKGCRSILNAYNFDFQPARPLFEKHGYRLIGIKENWPKGHTCYLLIKDTGDLPAAPDERTGYEVRRGSEEDGTFITDRLEAFNTAFAPRSHAYLDLNYKLTDEAGGLIAGCIAGVSGWDAAYIDVLWEDASYRRQGTAATLLAETERRAKALGAYTAFAETFGSQAAVFLENGYSICAVYEGEPKWYVMQKQL